MTAKHVSTKLWEAFEKVYDTSHNQIIGDLIEVRKELIRAGKKFGFSEQDLIDSGMLADRKKPVGRPGNAGGDKRNGLR
jgi:hypothetical protein